MKITAKGIELGKIIRKWHEQNGYYQTNLGWLHGDWITKGIKDGAISPYRDANKSGQPLIFSVKSDTKEGGFMNFTNWQNYIKVKRSQTKMSPEIEEAISSFMSERKYYE